MSWPLSASASMRRSSSPGSPCAMRSTRSTSACSGTRPSSRTASSTAIAPSLAGRELVEDRERVAVGARAGARDEVQHGLGRLDLLRLAHARQHLDELARPGPPEREALAARADRAQQLGRIGRAEHEHDVRRRLLERLQQRVRGVRGERVRLVQDVDLVAPLGRLLRDALDDLADVVDPAVRRGVHLDHVERGRIVDAQADRARAVGRRRRPVLAVERLREDLRERRLARPARPREQVRVRDAPLLDRARRACARCDPGPPRPRTCADGRCDRARPRRQSIRDREPSRGGCSVTGPGGASIRSAAGRTATRARPDRVA